MHCLLFYEVVEDYAEKRQPFRNEHSALAREFVERGQLILGGAFANPIDGAVLLFQVESPTSIQEFIDRDPYVQNGLITRWTIREWTTVVGPMANNPIGCSQADPKKQ